MAKAVRFYETGGPEVLRYEDVEVGEPGPGQVRLRHVAVGLNYADTYFRNGTYPIPMPNGMGVEGAGVVDAIGPDVTNVAVGDRVTLSKTSADQGVIDAIAERQPPCVLEVGPGSALAAGVTPETREAWPRVSGLWRLSF